MLILGFKKRTIVLFILLCSLLAIFSLIWYKSSVKKINTKPAKSSNVTNSGAVVTKSAAAKMISLTPEQRREQFKMWVKSQISFSNVEDASSEAPFKVKKPNSKGETLIGKPLVGIFVDKLPNEIVDKHVPDEIVDERVATLKYGDTGNPITIVERKELNPRYDKYVEQAEVDKEAGYLKSDSVPKIIYINGYKGVGDEPGYNLIGEKIPRPGFVKWTANDIEYAIYGTSGENATTLQELIEIAKTIE